MAAIGGRRNTSSSISVAEIMMMPSRTADLGFAPPFIPYTRSGFPGRRLPARAGHPQISDVRRVHCESRGLESWLRGESIVR